MFLGTALVLAMCGGSDLWLCYYLITKFVCVCVSLMRAFVAG